MTIKAMSELVQAANVATRDILTNAHMLHYFGRSLTIAEQEIAWRTIRNSIEYLTEAFENACPKEDHQNERPLRVIKISETEPF